MPRVSQKESEKTRLKIIDVALELLLSQGLEALTFTNIATKAEIGRSSINGHFKKKHDLLDALRPQLIDIVNSALDYSSAHNFYQSWVLAIQTNTKFRHTIANMESLVSKEMGLPGLIKLIDDDPKQSEKYIYMAIGYAVINIANYN